MANYQEDIYTAFRSALDTIGAPQTFQGYPIAYYDKTYQEDYNYAVEALLMPLDLIVDDEELPEVDLMELIDTNQAEIICDLNWTVEQKLKVMHELVVLIPMPKTGDIGVYDKTVIPKTVIDDKYKAKKPKLQPVEPVNQLGLL